MPRRGIPGPRTQARRRLIEKLLAERSKSGESYKALAKRSGIPAPTLAWWQKRLREEDGQEGRIELVEVKSPGLLAPGRIEVALPSGIVIRMPVGVGTEMLGQVLDLVVKRC
jgi:transposase-like protein